MIQRAARARHSSALALPLRTAASEANRTTFLVVSTGGGGGAAATTGQRVARGRHERARLRGCGGGPFPAMQLSTSDAALSRGRSSLVLVQL